MLGMHVVDALDGFPCFRRGIQIVNDVNSPDHQHFSFRFNLALYLGRQVFITRLDFARFQRTSECSDQSASHCGNDVIQSCGVRFSYVRADAVMLGNCAVNAELYRLIFGRQESEPGGAGLTLDADI